MFKEAQYLLSVALCFNNGNTRLQLTRSKSLALCIFLNIYENLWVGKTKLLLYTFINVSVGSMLSFCQCINHKSSKLLHTGPLKYESDTIDVRL